MVENEKQTMERHKYIGFKRWGWDFYDFETWEKEREAEVKREKLIVRAPCFGFCTTSFVHN